MLVLEQGLLKTIVDTLLDLLQPCVDPTTAIYKMTSRNYKHNRIFFIMHDLRWAWHLLRCAAVMLCVLCQVRAA